MRDGAEVLLLFAGMTLWFVALVLWTRLARDVVRVAPPQTNRPFQNLSEATDMFRIWREHVKHFPRSRRRRTFMWVSAAAAMVSLGFWTLIAK
jgi:hypothetical protein